MPMIVQLHEGVALKKFPLEDKPIFRIGRDPDSDIFIDDGVVSSDHAVIELSRHWRSVLTKSDRGKYLIKKHDCSSSRG